MSSVDGFLSKSELYKITGSRKPADQATVLRNQGFNPWIHPVTGTPILYREVFMKAQMSNTESNEFEMNLGAIND